MTTKSKITLIIFAIINLVATLLLTIYVLPNQIPVAYDINEKITHLGSKWIMLISSIIPIIISILSIILKNKKWKFALNALFILSLYENFLFFSYFIVGENLSIGSLCELPSSILIFTPLSMMFLVFSLKLKNAPYLSKPAINFKVTKETEFIWRQTHYYAQKVYFYTSFILFLVSLIFALFRLFIIEFTIFMLAIIISTLIIYLYSKSIYDKYIEMKERKERMENKMSEEEFAQSNKKRKKKKKNVKKIDGSNLM